MASRRPAQLEGGKSGQHEEMAVANGNQSQD